MQNSGQQDIPASGPDILLTSAASKFEGLISPVAKGANWISCIMAALMPLLIFVDVLSRALFSASVLGTIELEQSMLLILVFFSIPLIQLQNDHIRIDIFTNRIPEKYMVAIEVIIYALCFVLFVILSWQTLVQVGLKSNDVTYALSIPIPFFIIMAALGQILLSVVLLIDLIKVFARFLKHLEAANIIFLLAVTGAIALGGYAVAGADLSRFAIGVLGMILVFVFLFLGMPIGYSMALIGLAGLATVNSWGAALNLVGIAPYSTGSNYILIVAPLFILMGELAYTSGLSHDLFEAASKWFGRLPGGLAMSAVGGCAGFAAICGDSLATAITMGTVSLPEMKKKGYSMSLSTGCLAAGGTLGILIPPSVGFIFYAIVTEESIGKLFIAGIVPGLLLAVLFMGAIYIMAVRNPEKAPRAEKSTLGEKLAVLLKIGPIIGLFVLVLGGIMAGFFSPTEAGGIGAVGAFVYTLIRGRFTWSGLSQALQETVKITSKLLLILIGVGILNYFFAASRLPMSLANIVTAWVVNKYIIFGAIIFIFIILGCLMNVIPMILLTLPALYPAIKTLGFDPIWFGVVTVLVMEMGQITPPIGVNVFAIGSVAEDVPMGEIFKGVMPFFFCMVACIILLTLFPQIALFLPNLVF